MKKNLLFLLAACLLLMACQAQQGDNADKKPSPAAKTVTRSTSAEPQTKTLTKTPPTPPLSENFQGRPKLSLFPRAGAFRPEDSDTKGLQFWSTYIDHLIRTSGPVKVDKKKANIAFGFRAIKGLDSVGLFSPVAVKPNTRYEVRARISCQLAKGATTGIGVLEFDKFLWIGEQYPESLFKKHQVGQQKGIRLKGVVRNRSEKFSFTTGPGTAMIHLVFFREGTHDRNPVLLDDIEIKEIQQK